MDDLRADRAEQRIGRVHAFFPILPRLGNGWAATRPWEGLTLGLNLHLTHLTGALVRELVLGGATCVVSAANPATTDAGTVELLRGLGVEAYTGGDMRDRHLQVLDHHPELIVDVGFELTATLLDRRPAQTGEVRAAIEITQSGITALRARGGPLPFPVVNINDGRLKHAIENRHGVGDGVWQAVASVTGMHLAGRRVLVVGYGSVGSGLASYARAAGTSVEVVDTDPVRRLRAHYDGYPTPELSEGLARAGVAVTATGRSGAVRLSHLSGVRGGIVLANAGHGGDEIAIREIERAAIRKDHIADQVARYQLESGARITVLGDGHPLNIVMGAGSPEPVLLHFAVLGLTLEWLVGIEPPPPGELLIPSALEDRAAELALEALDAGRG